MIYDPKYSFVKHKLKNFNKISSIESKFGKIVECYQNFISLMDVDVEPENIEHKSVVLNKESKRYGDLIKEYKKVYERKPKNDEADAWKQKYKPKKLKDLNYQPVNPIVHGGSEVLLKHVWGEGGKFTLSPPAKIQTTKAVNLKLGKLIK